MRIKFIFLTILSVVLMSGCSEKKDADKKSQLSISLPAKFASQKVGALSETEMVMHIAISVTGAGIPSPILFQWDAKKGGSTTDTQQVAPTSIDLQIPFGDNRLVQVLIVTGSNEDSANFYYGDTVKSFFNPIESAIINLSVFAQNVSVSGGRIMGRYLDSSGVGPTGELYVSYKPSGKPAMVIEKAQMVSGWFQAFALKDFGFHYKLADGRVIFDNLSMQNLTPSANLSIVNIPSSYVCYNSSGTTCTSFEQRGDSLLAVGYFGPGATTKKACTKLPETGYTSTRYFSSSTSQTGFGFSRISASDAFPTNAISVKGGLSSSECSALNFTESNVFNDFIGVELASLDQNGDHSLAGFVLPFKIKNNGGPFDVTGDQNQLTFVSEFLPGISDVFNGMTVYKRYNNSMEENHDEFRQEVPCDLISRGELPEWQFFAESSINGSTASTPISMADLMDTTNNSMPVYDLMFCPSSYGKFSKVGLFLNHRYLNGPGGGGDGGTCTSNCGSGTSIPYARFEFNNMEQNDGFAIGLKNICYSVRIRLYMNGSDWMLPSGTSASLNVTSFSGSAFYSDSNCATALGSNPVVIAQNTTESAYFYFKATTPFTDGQFSITNIPTNTSSAALFGFSPTSNKVSIGNPEFMLSMATVPVQDACYYAEIKVKNSITGNPIQNISSFNFIKVTSPYNDLSFQASCSSAATAQSFDLINANDRVVFYFKAIDTATRNLSIYTVDSPNNSTNINTNLISALSQSLTPVVSTLAPTATSIQINGGSSSIEFGKCYPVDIVSKNAEQKEVPFGISNLTISRSYNIRLFDNANCYWADYSSPYSIDPQASRLKKYIKIFNIHPAETSLLINGTAASLPSVVFPTNEPNWLAVAPPDNASFHTVITNTADVRIDIPANANISCSISGGGISQSCGTRLTGSASTGVYNLALESSLWPRLLDQGTPSLFITVSTSSTSSKFYEIRLHDLYNEPERVNVSIQGFPGGPIPVNNTFSLSVYVLDYNNDAVGSYDGLTAWISAHTNSSCSTQSLSSSLIFSTSAELNDGVMISAGASSFSSSFFNSAGAYYLKVKIPARGIEKCYSTNPIVIN